MKLDSDSINALERQIDALRRSIAHAEGGLPKLAADKTALDRNTAAREILIRNRLKDPSTRSFGVASKAPTGGITVDFTVGFEPTGSGRSTPRPGGVSKSLAPDQASDDDLVQALAPAFAKSAPPEAAPKAEPVADAEPEASVLEFVLDGPAARGMDLLAGSAARLVFQQVLATLAEGTVVTGAKLDALLQGEHSLQISLTPDDGLEITGPQTATATFSAGRLVEPVVFPLKAGDASSGARGIHVEFHVAGTRLYEFRLSIEVLPTGSSLPDKSAPTTLALDAVRVCKAPVAVPLPERHIRGKLRFQGGCLNFGIEDYIAGQCNDSIDECSTIDRSMLDLLRSQVVAALGAHFYASDAWESFDGSHAEHPANQRALKRATERMAVAGGVLFRGLASDPLVRKVLEYIDKLPQGTRITIVTKDVSLPLELVYPRRYDPDDPEQWPLDPTLFWGARFAFETLNLGNGNYAELTRARSQASQGVSLNLNPTITINDEAPRQAVNGTAKELRALGTEVAVNDECQHMRATLLKADTAATLIYVYCHGSPPSSAAAAQFETLNLADGCDINADNIDSERPYANAPIVFLNACRAGSLSSLSFTGFLKAFRNKKALGLIAPSFDVPIVFGHRFGMEVVEACCRERGTSLADLMLKSRLDYLQQGNPIPLFYAVQCQVDHL